MLRVTNKNFFLVTDKRNCYPCTWISWHFQIVLLFKTRCPFHLQIYLTPDSHPVRVHLHNYSQYQKLFIKHLVSEIFNCGIIYPNLTDPWAVAPILVPKPGPSRFRFTVHLKPVNKYTVCYQYWMPVLEQELCNLSSSKVCSNFYLSHGYWQLPLVWKSQEFLWFMKPEGVFSPTWVLHCTTNSVTYIQSPMQQIILKCLRGLLLQWLDDFLLHTGEC